MTILVTGAGGQVGRELVMRAGHRALVGLDRSQLDITDVGAVAAAVSAHRARLVINAAAWTAVDQAENEPDAAWARQSRRPGRARGRVRGGRRSTSAYFDRLCVRRTFGAPLRRDLGRRAPRRVWPQ